MGEFFLSGQIFVCLFCYFLAEYLGYWLSTLPGRILAQLIAKFNWLGSKKNVREVMTQLGIVKIKKGTEFPLPGKNIDILIDLSRVFQDEEAKNEMLALKSTFISNVCELYSALVVMYFVVLPSSIQNNTLSAFILFFFLLICLGYAVIHAIVDYLSDHYEEIISSLSFIKTNALIFSVLNSFSIYPVKAERKDGLKKMNVFYRSRKEYVLCPPIINKQILLYRYRQMALMLRNRQKENRMFIIVAMEGLLTNTEALQFEFADRLILIEYRTDTVLRQKLTEAIVSL